MESTYGDRLHKDEGLVADRLADVINRTAARGGKIIVPAFAVGRTQQLVLLLHQLANENRIPQDPDLRRQPAGGERHRGVPQEHRLLRRRSAAPIWRMAAIAFGFKMLTYIREASESKKLNDLHGPFVVISASGMCEAGRILHHLRNNIEDPRNTVLITGFQAENTLGRKLVEKWPEVNIFGEPMRVRAEDRFAARIERPRRPARAARMDDADRAGSEEGLPGARRAARPAGAGQADRGALSHPGGDSGTRRIASTSVTLTWISSPAISAGSK